MTAEIDRLIMKVYETNLMKKDAEIKALQSQMNPHFLFNTLGTIESLAAMQGDSRNIRMICRSLAQMLRHNISGASFSTLGEEVLQIEQNLFIQKIRYGSRLEYEIKVEAGLENMRIPKLLFQPIVENGITHGIEGLRRGGELIYVRSYVLRDFIISWILDLAVMLGGAFFVYSQLKDIMLQHK
ncbi:histidine kinase [Paenibacillus frigoriresistens]|uniref:sensor histidine kinase n=1 Tax=Paenibacillus alginolyticus TaxID=59839 RepID=UPI0015663898|nr:histidine kinase [Paenibacillus frigoriresistens]NRF94760.1 histidine kinase [Paenibacillus frigoriresistens]